MKKLLFCLLLVCVNAHAQFTPGQVLTAAQLNAQFALKANLSGAAFTGGISATGITGTPISGSTGSFSNLTATGTVTLPNASITLGNLTNQAANTVLANATASSSSPTAVAMPSCSTSASALNYTTSSGFSCNTAINANQLGGATFASPGSIGSTTPGSGTFTTLSVTSNFTPSQTNGIIGTTTNNNANAGSVGELIIASVASGSAVSLTTNTPANITSISLTAGDWEVQGDVYFTGGTATVGIYRSTSVSQTSATLDLTVPNYNIVPDYGSTPFGSTTGNVNGLGVFTPVIRKSLASTTTIFLVAQAGFNTSTMSAYGAIRARRVR